MSFLSPFDSRGSLAACFALALAVGCSNAPDMVPVTGKVTFDGKPLAFGTVMFQLKSGGQPATGEIQPDGTYKLATFPFGEGARLGEHLVRITCFEGNDPARKKSTPTGEVFLGKSLIPAKYESFGSGLTAIVTAEGEQKFDFELTK